MYDANVHSVRSGNTFTLTLTTPVAQGGKEPGDYEGLINKPRINGIELVGDMTLEMFGLPNIADIPSAPLSEQDLEDIINS